MSLTYGPWEYGGGNGMRVGIDPSSAAVAHGDATVVLTFLVSTENQYNYDDFQTLTFGGSAGSGTYDYNNQSATGSGDVLRTTRTYTYTYGASSYGTSPGSVTFSAAVSGAYNGTTPSHTVTVAIPARPYGAPAAPTAASVARVSDSKQTVTWTNHSTTGEPYTNVEVWRATDGGAYVRIAVLGAVVTYSDATTSLGHRYQYRVRATNSVGESGYATTGTIDTTPPAPGTPAATKSASGDIVITWTNTAAWATNVEVWHASNGVWDASPLVTLGMVLTYTHASPSAAVTHAYRLRNVGTAGLVSAYSASSNTVQLLAAPIAPTALSPASVARDATADLTLAWQHNPVDTTAQHKYEVQCRLNGGSWVSLGVVTSSTSSRTVTGGTWSNGASLEWQVRTWGTHTDPSPWSATALVALSSPPVVTITSPVVGSPWTTSALTVTWTYADPEGTAQAVWYSTLRSATGTALEYRSAAGAATSTTFTTALANGATYRVDVSVRDSAGSTAVQSRTFTVSYALPMVPTVAVDWRPSEASSYVTVTNPATVSPAVDTDHNEVWRSADGGATWALIDNAVPSGGTVVDTVPPLGVPVTYKAVAVSALPSVADSTQTVQTDGVDAVWVNGGPGFAQSVRLVSNVTYDVEASLEKVLRQFDGRTKPVEFAGTATSRSVSLSATLFAPWVAVSNQPSTWAEIEALAMLPGPHCFRDPDGVRLFGSLAVVQIRGLGVGATRGVSMTLTETDWSE